MARKKTRELDRAKFVQLANRRVPAAAKAVDLVSNLANRNNYDFTDDDAKAIIKRLKKAVADCESRFSGESPSEVSFRLE
jgi:hypothetical protein